MNPGVINRCIDTRPRKQAPPAMHAAPMVAPTGVLAFGGFAVGEREPEAAT